MNKLSGTLPKAMAVITVPEAIVTGATPIIRVPMEKSGQLAKKY
jgi:hypothetical protein